MKIILGIQTPTEGGTDRLLENVTENLESKTKVDPRMTPIAKCMPIPPLVFLEATVNPMIVKMSMVTGSAVRRCNSISYFFELRVPLSVSR